MADILDRASGCLLPEGPDLSEAPLAKGEVHRRLWGSILSFFGADLVVGVGSHASVTFPLEEREGIDFFEAQHSNFQDVVDATQRIDLEYCKESRRVGIAEHAGASDVADDERFARLRTAAGLGQHRDSRNDDDALRGDESARTHDFPHCAICFQDASDGEAWVRFPCQHGMHSVCWDEYGRHAVDYHRGLRTCPTCRERLVTRSNFRSQFGPYDIRCRRAPSSKDLPHRLTPDRGGREIAMVQRQPRVTGLPEVFPTSPDPGQRQAAKGTEPTTTGLWYSC